ncbi:MAG: putative transporter [Methanoregulaceae archaeon PtaB.Bin056]|jgi:EmrB/QacA subfamily drug resistance transporter|nr:MAG: putative transporter [Methanoregulaceae archaeon PtaB.Bin056]
MQRVILFIAVISSFITPFDGSAVNIALPAIGQEFSLDAVTLSWITTSYLLSIAILLVPFGKLADMKGRKRMFLIGISTFSAASVLLAFSADAGMLIGLRLLQGAGCAMIFGTSLAILSAAYHPRERGKVLGITIAAVYLGLSLGPFLGGIMTERLGWRSIFLVNAPLGILCIVFAIWKLPLEWRDEPGQQFDIAGSLLWAVSLIATIYGLSILPSLAGAALIGTGIVLLVVFGAFELRSPSPVLNMQLFLGNRVFAFSNFAALINYSATYAVTFLLSLYLQVAKDFTAEYAGLILVAQPAMQALFSPLAGKLSDNIDPGLVASGGMAVTVAGLFLLTFLDAGSSIPFILGCLLFLGVGFGFFSSPNTNAILGSVDRRSYGVASGMVGTMRLLGQMLSMGLAMTIFATSIGREEIGEWNIPEFIESIHIAFLLFFALCVVGLAFSLVRGKKRGAENAGTLDS